MCVCKFERLPGQDYEERAPAHLEIAEESLNVEVPLLQQAVQPARESAHSRLQRKVITAVGYRPRREVRQEGKPNEVEVTGKKRAAGPAVDTEVHPARATRPTPPPISHPSNGFLCAGGCSVAFGGLILFASPNDRWEPPARPSKQTHSRHLHTWGPLAWLRPEGTSALVRRGLQLQRKPPRRATGTATRFHTPNPSSPTLTLPQQVARKAGECWGGQPG